jgi:putative tryptophan/tyrosine transport system ATP-binding protein
MILMNKISKIFDENTPFQNTVIDNLNLKISEGDFITIIGSNGAGKTTLFNLISGNVFPTSGRIYIDDEDITYDPEYRRALYIGRIFQNPLLGTAANMTIEENLMIAYKKGMRGLKISFNGKLKSFFKDELKQLNMHLEDRIGSDVGLLSGGQRQALTLLMMVMSRPRLILLDEHTAALDPKNSDIVLGLTNKFINEYKLTAMMITHNMNYAIEHGTRLLMMDKGRVIFEMKGDEKQVLTKEKLVEKFHEATKDDFQTDEVLLSNK